MTGPKSPNSVDRHVGARLAALRKVRRLTQAELARKLGVTTQQVQKYEKGMNRISAARLYQIAAGLNVRLGYFFRDLIAPKAQGPKGRA